MPLHPAAFLGVAVVLAGSLIIYQEWDEVVDLAERKFGIRLPRKRERNLHAAFSSGHGRAGRRAQEEQEEPVAWGTESGRDVFVSEHELQERRRQASRRSGVQSSTDGGSVYLTAPNTLRRHIASPIEKDSSDCTTSSTITSTPGTPKPAADAHLIDLNTEGLRVDNPFSDEHASNLVLPVHQAESSTHELGNLSSETPEESPELVLTPSSSSPLASLHSPGLTSPTWTASFSSGTASPELVMAPSHHDIRAVSSASEDEGEEEEGTRSLASSTSEWCEIDESTSSTGSLTRSFQGSL
ncbi:hypothetical protein SAICODRAFT_7067 [Saitoella complicata NRRL Y-17804]|uniref:Transmembrane protein n=1 Tax=Saitoella complicata (strain BCRC 22490 / CBS 7301 / JCM 7358 / NBRC 10748 / NRRL Y-17804) TaxID=698492 RepID=A0A0E9NGC7_SAICN|nr:uncharacterized protein SAICODRAFT_7067 [Saitoella complicata NRRL Y-17804]ODQ53344.1 hypothetical protein SAICODRAFT_7067 [Saitoella complicata NRRL Y-17804]GAO48884.1 hypothetical protein G7K_3047-t1 [Saitoella complicata NRRL Y-17804]